MRILIKVAFLIFLLPTATLARGIENSTWSIPGSSQITVSVSNGNFIVDYPEMGCSGYWDVKKKSRATYVFTERLISGERCTDGARIRAFVGVPGRMQVNGVGKVEHIRGHLRLQQTSNQASLLAPVNYGTVPKKLLTQEERRQIQEEKKRIASEKAALEYRQKEAEKQERIRQIRQQEAELQRQKLAKKEEKNRRSKEYVDVINIQKNVSVIGDLETQNSGAGIVSFANTRLKYEISITDQSIVNIGFPVFLLISADSVVLKNDKSVRRKTFFLKKKLDLCDGYYVLLYSGNNYSYRRSAENSVSVKNEFEGIGGIWSGLTKENWVGENLDVEIDIMLASSEAELVFQRNTRYDFCFFNREEKDLWISYLGR